MARLTTAEPSPAAKRPISSLNRARRACWSFLAIPMATSSAGGVTAKPGTGVRDRETEGAQGAWDRAAGGSGALRRPVFSPSVAKPGRQRPRSSTGGRNRPQSALLAAGWRDGPRSPTEGGEDRWFCPRRPAAGPHAPRSASFRPERRTGQAGGRPSGSRPRAAKSRFTWAVAVARRGGFVLADSRPRSMVGQAAHTSSHQVSRTASSSVVCSSRMTGVRAGPFQRYRRAALDPAVLDAGLDQRGSELGVVGKGQAGGGHGVPQRTVPVDQLAGHVEVRTALGVEAATAGPPGVEAGRVDDLGRPLVHRRPEALDGADADGYGSRPTVCAAAHRRP